MGEHPLRELATGIMGAVPYIPVGAADKVIEPRSFRPENFVVFGNVPRHMLLIEDSWVTGARTQSVSACLKAAGVEQVTALVIARFLTPGFGETNAFLSTLTVPFDPDICPYAGNYCQPR